MADIRCSHCGKNNPDFLDVCQFCQSPLKPESMLHIGEEPTKKDTGELEEILPDWLKDARQQGKNVEAADEAFRSQTKPKIPKEEPPDLLAGLMSQAESDEDEVPDWLAGINPVAEKKPSSPKPSSADEEEPSDFFAQFKQPETKPSIPTVSEPPQEDVPAWMGMEGKPSEQKDELTDWFSQAPAELGATAPDDNSWMKDLGSFDATEQKPPAEKEPEDLSWLHDLEAASKGTGDLPAPKKDAGFDFAPSSSGEDLSWLNNLGGTSAPSFEEPAPSQPTSSDDDLSWLSNLGGTPAPSFEEPVPSQPASSDDDLSWLNNLGGTSAPSFEEPAPSQPASSDDDLSWLSNLGGTSAPSFEEPIPSQPSSAQEDLDWLSNLGETSEPSEPTASTHAQSGEPQASGTPASTSSKPFRTAPLNELLSDDSFKDATPDWLKNAMEEPSMPPPGAVSMDWFSEHSKPADAESAGRPGVPTQEEPASSQAAFDFSLGDTSTSSEQDVDALFMEMPDWLSREPEGAEASKPTASAPDDDTLSPVELPSWVQAMRPVDSAIGDISASSVDQITEREGPLAGFRGVIPSAPIGSSLRPKAFSLKLQITEDQQTSASLLEQIITSETAVQPPKEVAGVSSQRVLRWALSGLFLVVLGIVIGLGLQTMPIFASATVNELSDLVASVPDNSPVLVVIDYEPSFTGELEAAAGPLLDQLALSRHSTFTFVSMSPNGSALVDRLMFNTGISRPVDDEKKGGLGYQLGDGYFNLGFLPGGSAGVLGFITAPENNFAQYATVILMTDNAETGRVWVEQLEAASPEIAGKPLFLVSSVQSGPLLQPYVSSGQVDIMVNGLSDASKYEAMNTTRPGTARAYWDAFGIGLMMAIIAIALGSVWSVLVRIRERRTEAEQG